MNDLTSRTKDELEGSIRHDKPTTLDTLGIANVSAWAFLKTAVLDWSEESKRSPRISRLLCTRFRESVTSRPRSLDIAIPKGFQLWIAQYRSDRALEAITHIDELRPVGPYRGYAILMVTYVVGHLMFQATFPKWVGLLGKRPPIPAFERINDLYSERIWPFVSVAHWPPPRHVSRSTFEGFRERFRRVLIARRT